MATMENRVGAIARVVTVSALVSLVSGQTPSNTASASIYSFAPVVGPLLPHLSHTVTINKRNPSRPLGHPSGHFPCFCQDGGCGTDARRFFALQHTAPESTFAPACTFHHSRRHLLCHASYVPQNSGHACLFLNTIQHAKQPGPTFKTNNCESRPYVRRRTPALWFSG